MEEPAMKEPKHMGIFTAIDELRGTYNKLEQLYRNAGGSADPPNDEAVDQERTLSYLLDSGADLINNLCIDINRKINELRSLIL